MVQLNQTFENNFPPDSGRGNFGVTLLTYWVNFSLEDYLRPVSLPLLEVLKLESGKKWVL